MMKTFGIFLIATFAWLQTTWANDDAWLTDLTKAQALAKKENKVVLMDFTGSDWCPPCKALHRNVLTAKEFTDFAKEKLVLVLVDFPTVNRFRRPSKKLTMFKGHLQRPCVSHIDCLGQLRQADLV